MLDFPPVLASVTHRFWIKRRGEKLMWKLVKKKLQTSNCPGSYLVILTIRPQVAQCSLTFPSYRKTFNLSRTLI